MDGAAENCPLCGAPAAQPSLSASERLIDFYRQGCGLDVTSYFDSDQISTYRCGQCGLAWHRGCRPADEAVYDALQQMPGYYEDEKPEFQWARDWIARLKPATLVEFGAGRGAFLRSLNTMPASSLFASELSPKSRQALLDMGIQADDGRTQHDLAVSFQVLEHVPNPADFLHSLASRVKAGGHLILSTPNPDSPYLTETDPLLDYPPHHFSRWPRSAFEKAAKDRGLTVEDYFTESMRPSHWVSVRFHRRQQGASLAKKIWRRLALTADHLTAPLASRLDSSPGHTHGVLLRKP